MKKLSIVCSVILALALITAPAFAQNYRIDILETGNPGGWGGASLKSFDDPAGLDVLAAGTYSMDIWVTGGGALGVLPTAGGVFMPYGAGINVTDVLRYNNDAGELPGPWGLGAGVDPGGTGPGPATIVAVVAHLAGGAVLDGAGDLIICRVDFTCTDPTAVSVAVSTIPSVPTWGPDPPWTDGNIVPTSLDVCQVEVCTVDSDCLAFGDPCNPVTCESMTLVTDYCGYIGNTCLLGTPPPCDDGVPCTDDVCTTGVGCVYTPVDANCDDSIVCTIDVCDSVTDCSNTPDDGACDDSELCTTDACDQPGPGTGCSNTNNTLPCDDGVYCTLTDVCSGGGCVGTGDPCDDSNTCTDDTCNEGTTDCTNDCNAVSAVDPCCDDPACDGFGICAAGGSVSIGDFWANCGDVGIKINLCLQNLEIPIGGFQMDICENPERYCSISMGLCSDDSDCPAGPTDTCGDIVGALPDCIECVECELTERTVVFDCVVNELPNGCCRVILFAKHPGGLINPGECDIVTIVYQFVETPDPACCETCIQLDGTGIVLSDEYGYDVLGVIAGTGEICPFVCGDVWPGESAPGAGDCGDSVIDIFDILEEVDIALNGDADACQVGPRSDVPTGTPPYCIDPDGVVNILDVMVVIDMVLDRQDCCSYWYAGIIY